MGFEEAARSFRELLAAAGLATKLQAHWSMGRYGADSAAFALSQLGIHHAWAVADLASVSKSTIIGATACARCSLEIGALSAWLTQPEDPFARETRWLGWYAD